MWMVLAPLVIAASASTTCPPEGFKSVADFDLNRYVSAPWYPVEQQPLGYQPISQFYCVQAKYEPLNPSDYSEGIAVLNSARDGSVTGPLVGSTDATGGGIIAFPDDTYFQGKRAESKLRVGPSFFKLLWGRRRLKTLLFGPYWVVAVDEANYDWAIVTGGPPNAESNGACIAGSSLSFLNNFKVNGVGLWLFHRNPQPGSTAVQAMRDAATALGFDVSVLQPVEHAGCTYPGDE